MHAKTLVCIVATSAAVLSVNADVFTDEFNGVTLNPRWTVGDNADSYFPGGGASLTGDGKYQIVNSKIEGASNIRASLGMVTAADSVRADAIVRTDQFNSGRWSNQVAIYFNNENWMSLRLGYNNGESGFLRQGMVSGTNYWDHDAQGPTGTIQWSHNILGVELTATQIKFYSSAVGGDFTDTTDIDANVSLIPSLTMARPASFTGEAFAIIGKGFATSNAHPAYLNNSGGSTGSSPQGNNYISFARLTGITPAGPGWAINASGDWNTASNWNGGVPNAVDATATFGTVISSPRTIFTDTPVTAGAVVFDNANTYQIAGNGSLTLDVSTGSAQVNVLQGSHKINLPLIFADNTNVTVASGATLIIANPSTIKAGKIVSKTGNVSIEAPLTIEANGGLNLVSGTTSVFGAPSLAAGASVNVQANSLNIDYRGQTSPASTVRTQLLAGYAGGAWNGAGIKTSSAVAGQTGLGWNDNTGSESITVKYTYYGDTNLTGTVDSTDFSALVAAYGTTSGAVWAQGDFDYDGKVNTKDFNYLAGNFGKAAIPSAALGAVVPEPASAALLLIGAASLLTRRQRGN